MARSRAWDGSEVHDDHIDFLRQTQRLPGKDYVKCELTEEWRFGKETYSRADPTPMSPLLQPAAGAAGPERQFLPDRVERDVDDPDLGAAALEDDAEGGGGKAGGSRLRASLEDWPDDDAGEVAPRHQPGFGQPGASSSAAPDAQGSAKKRRAAPSLFGSQPKKPKGSSAATKRDDAAVKAIRFRKAVKEPQLSAAASIVGSAETSTTTRRIDPAADLRESTERNAGEVRKEHGAARLEKAEMKKVEAAALKKLAEAEAADAAKKQAEEAARRQSAVFVTPLNSAPPPPEFMAQTGEAGDEHPIMERDGEANAALQQQLGKANTALHAKEEECGKLAEERDRLVAQVAEQAELLKKAQKEAEDKEAGLLAEFATERSAWTEKETSSLVTRTPPIRPLKLIAKDGGRKAHRSLPTPPGPLASSS
nr:uncharacterized protein LOC120969081 [Aegilops tauschii subsp. strangulata]